MNSLVDVSSTPNSVLLSARDLGPLYKQLSNAVGSFGLMLT